MTDHPLVSTQWLADHLSSPDLVVVNAWMPPVTHPDAPPVYPNAHIPGAVFFDVNEICEKNSDLPHMLPAPHVFSSAMRKLGIGDGQTIVVYDDFGFYSAPRVWWTLKAMGAERVHVLDGGFPKWRAEGRPFDDQEPLRTQSHFSSRLNHGAVADLDDIKSAITSENRQILDARSHERFTGEASEPRPGLRPGHMPSALNLPFTKLISEDGTFRSRNDLVEIFEEAGLNLDQPVTTSCGSGVTAAILTLGLTIAGARDLALYDGSWAEWGGRDDTEIVTGTA
ncbi:3-mercaptopyruvate sulfurtransferase [Rhodobacterales bacterium]|nr:3-mercaptopyruvate sulfurtransferase [Rhodobacterales bacterium]